MTAEAASRTTRRYCLCGATAAISSTPPDAALAIAAMWDGRHSGEGHGPATSQQASQARRRQTRADQQAQWEECNRD